MDRGPRPVTSLAWRRRRRRLVRSKRHPRGHARLWFPNGVIVLYSAVDEPSLGVVGEINGPVARRHTPRASAPANQPDQAPRPTDAPSPEAKKLLRHWRATGGRPRNREPH